MRDRLLPGRALVPAVVVGGWALALIAAFVLPAGLRPFVVAPVVLLTPGFAGWRALAPSRPILPHRELLASLVLGLVVHALALMATFALQRSIVLTIGLELGAALVLASVAALRSMPGSVGTDPGWRWFGVAGAISGLTGLVLEQTTLIEVDAPFHLGRVRKLAELGHLSTARMAELVDGSNHPGYAFPLWHEVIASTARVSRIDPSVAYTRVGAPFAILAGLVTYALVVELVGRRDVAVSATTILAGIAIATDYGQKAPWTQKASWSLLSDPPSAVTQIFLPVFLVCLLLYAIEPGIDTLILLASSSAAVSIIHPTYLPLALIPVTGALVLDALRERRVQWRRLGLGALAVLAPFIAYTLWVLPLARDTADRTGGSGAVADAVALYGGRLEQIHEWHGLILLDPRFLLLKSHVALAAIAIVVALVLVPGRRSRWFLGGVATLVVIALVPPFFDVLQRVLTISQARRLGLFLPVAPVLAIASLGAVGRLRRPLLAVPAALVLGVLAVLIPGGSRLVVVVVIAATLALLAAFVLVAMRRAGNSSANTGSLGPRLAPVVALCLAAPSILVGVPAFAHHVSDPGPPAYSLSNGLVQRLRALPHGTVIAGDLSASYLIPAYTLDTIVAAPPKNVANTSRNDPYLRAAQMTTVLKALTPDSERRAILEHYHAQYLLLDRRHEKPVDQVLRRTAGYQVVYRERRPKDRNASYFVLYRLRF